MVGAQHHVVLARRVVDVHERGRLARGLQALGDDGGDHLPAVGDLARLQDLELAVVDVLQARRVAVPRIVLSHCESQRSRLCAWCRNFPTVAVAIMQELAQRLGNCREY